MAFLESLTPEAKEQQQKESMEAVTAGEKIERTYHRKKIEQPKKPQKEEKEKRAATKGKQLRSPYTDKFGSAAEKEDKDEEDMDYTNAIPSFKLVTDRSNPLYFDSEEQLNPSTTGPSPAQQPKSDAIDSEQAGTAGSSTREEQKSNALAIVPVSYFQSTHIHPPMLCPFSEDPLQMPSEEDKERFYKWFHVDYRPKNKKKKWSDGKCFFSPHFDYKVDSVDSKYWFYTLLTPAEWLYNSHLDVAFYYLRKKVRVYPQEHFISCMLLDTNFHNYIDGIWNKYKNVENFDWSGYNFSEQSVLQDMTLGCYLYCSWPFADVEYLLIPMFLSGAEHWILGFVSFVEMTIDIYNTLNPRNFKSELEEVAMSMAIILPRLLDSIGFFDSFNGPYLNSQYKKGDPFQISFLKTVEQENGGDCGMMVIKIAELLMSGRNFDCFSTIKMEQFREKIAVELFNHGMNKNVLNYDSDDQRGARLKKVPFIERDFNDFIDIQP